MELTCSTCKEVKNCLEFSRKNKSKRGYSYKCKKCHNEYSKIKWYPENREKQIESSANWRTKNYIPHKARRYGVDEKEAVELYEKADGKCQICGIQSDLCLDHCHKTVKLRGFLCNHCNLGLGHFLDDINILENAIKYLSLS